MTEQLQPFAEFGTVPPELWLPFFELLKQSHFTIESWTPAMAPDIYTQLEHPNWAPWLEASEATIAGRATVFPEGQLALKENGLLVASLSMNQINWDGNPDTLPSWDEVAGAEVTDYSQTYQPEGNTLVLMSMNVAPDAKGKQLPAKLIEYVKLLAQDKGFDHVIGSFRPSGYGQYKLEQLAEQPIYSPYGIECMVNKPPLTKYGEKVVSANSPFWSYCTMNVPETAKPYDPWLRSLWWAGMVLMKEDSWAMEVQVSQEEWEMYQHNYHPELWKLAKSSQSGAEIWECGEVGEWMTHVQARLPNGAFARYRESNVWGVIPFK